MRTTASLSSDLRDGLAAGLMGTAAMTAFQLLVEMPLSGRDESHEPADLVEKVSGVRPDSPTGRRQLNYAAHAGVGVGWGLAHASLARRWDLAGPVGGVRVFAALWPGDAFGLAALGVHPPPWQWSAKDAAVDVSNKLVLAVATSVTFDVLRRRRARS